MCSSPHCIWTSLIWIPLLAAGLLGQVEKNQPDLKISLDVEQVMLTVSVRDRAGRHVPELGQDAFRVIEDGKRQQIGYFSREDVPVTVGLLIDNSRSMRSKHNEVMAAALAFIRHSNPQDQVFVVNFNEHVRLGLPESLEFTANPVALRKALSSVVLDGQTALYDAIGVGLDHLERGQWEKNVLLVVSDGGDNASSLTLGGLLARLKRANALVYTIAVYDAANEERNLSVLKKLSKVSGGDAYFPRRIEDISGVCEEIANDIRSQYTIAYRSTNPDKDGSFRKIRVTAAGPEGRKFLVRTRPGYYATRREP